MKWLAMVLFLVTCSVVGVWVYGNHLIGVGGRESKWITSDMWPAKYFNHRGSSLDKVDRVFIDSLTDGSSKKTDLISFAIDNKCNDLRYECYVTKVAAASLMIDGADFDSGLRYAFEANNDFSSVDLCTIAFESVILRYKIKEISVKGVSASRSSAKKVIEKIKRDGGIIGSLKSPACNKLSKTKPEYFHAYVLLVSELMGFAGGEYSKASAYIESSVK